MGLIKAALGATKASLADQWKEYFHCDSMDASTLVAKAQRHSTQSTFGSSNTKGSADFISDGSIIAVNEGQAMILVEDGKVIDFTCEAGAFKYEASTGPTMLSGSFGEGLKNTFKQIGGRFTFGGDTGKAVRAYYVNTKEIMGNKFGSSSPVPYDDPYYKTVLYIRYFGSYSFRIQNPLLFYNSVAGNVTNVYKVSDLIEQCDSEFYTALDTALNSLAMEGVKFSMLPSKQREIAKFMNDTLDDEWVQRRGLIVEAVGINKVTPDDKSRKRIEDFDNATMLGGNQAAMQGRMVGAQATAFENMGKNPNGASGMDMMGMMFGMQAMQGMNNMNGGMMGGMHGAAPVQPQQNVAQPQAPATAHAPATPVAAPTPAEPATPATHADDMEIDLGNTWTCGCGTENTTNFCAECGAKRPVVEEKPVEVKPATWMCACGTECTGKFCHECGAKRNEEKHYKCDKCGWAPEDDTKPPKFCPECGDKFDSGDEI